MPADPNESQTATAGPVGVDAVLSSLRDSEELSDRDAQEWLSHFVYEVIERRPVEPSRLRETLDELKMTFDEFGQLCRKKARGLELLRLHGELPKREAAAREAMQALSDNSAAAERERRELEERHAARHAELYQAQAAAAGAARESREAIAELQRTSPHAAEYGHVMQDRSREADKLGQLQIEHQAAEREFQRTESEAERVGPSGQAAADLRRVRAALERVERKIAEQAPIVEQLDARLAALAELVTRV